MRLLLPLVLSLSLVASAGPSVAEERGPILDSPPSFGEGQFQRSCLQGRGYGEAQCACALRALRKQFDGQERRIALLYLQLALIAEHDVEAITLWLDPAGDGSCPSTARSSITAEIGSRHLAPSYLYGALRSLRVEVDHFKNWERRDEILEIRERCLPPPAAVLRQAGRIEACIEQALSIKHCSRCHDFRGVDLTQ